MHLKLLHIFSAQHHWPYFGSTRVYDLWIDAYRWNLLRSSNRFGVVFIAVSTFGRTRRPIRALQVGLRMGMISSYTAIDQSMKGRDKWPQTWWQSAVNEIEKINAAVQAVVSWFTVEITPKSAFLLLKYDWLWWSNTKNYSASTAIERDVDKMHQSLTKDCSFLKLCKLIHAES